MLPISLHVCVIVFIVIISKCRICCILPSWSRQAWYNITICNTTEEYCSTAATLCSVASFAGQQHLMWKVCLVLIILFMIIQFLLLAWKIIKFFVKYANFFQCSCFIIKHHNFQKETTIYISWLLILWWKLFRFRIK